MRWGCKDSIHEHEARGDSTTHSFTPIFSGTTWQRDYFQLTEDSSNFEYTCLYDDTQLLFSSHIYGQAFRRGMRSANALYQVRNTWVNDSHGCPAGSPADVLYHYPCALSPIPDLYIRSSYQFSRDAFSTRTSRIETKSCSRSSVSVATTCRLPAWG